MIKNGASPDTKNIQGLTSIHVAVMTKAHQCLLVLQKAGADLLHMRAGDDYVKVLQKFFINRSR